MNTIYLDLDLSKEPEETQTVYIRQGERNANAIEADVRDRGEPVDLSQYKVMFEMRHPKGALLSDEVAEVEGSTLRYVLPEQAAFEVGVAGVAYFAMKDKAGPGDAAESSLYATTQAFAVVVLPNAQGDKNAVAEAYSSEIEAMLKWCREEFDKAEAERTAKNEAAVQKAEEAAKNANDAADLVHDALEGEMGPLFGTYLESIKDVPGGLVSFDAYDAAWMTDDEFIEYVTQEGGGDAR